MRFPIKIAAPWRLLFRVFGFKPADSYVGLEDGALRFHFGTADETIPLSDIDRVEPRRWPFFYGLGPKLDVANGVAYVGSTEGVLRIWLKRPRRMNVWGAFRRSETHAVTVSLEDPSGFIAALEQARSTP
ncbi:MAG: hypothetical protein HY906_14495 [Deltaproteobacteria bacterium]|nr:hypothetical protein [Deltaproteobacteria bacterium]